MQTELFHDSIEDAYRTAVAQMGGFEAVGADLWPGKSRKAAGNLLSDVLNPDRPNKFSLEEHVHFCRVSRDRGVHLPIQFFCDEAGYDRPHPIDQQDEEAEIARQMERAAEMFQASVERLQRINGAAELRKVAAVK